jgi:hypothetical protein
MGTIAQLVGLGSINAANANLQAWKKPEKIQSAKKINYYSWPPIPFTFSHIGTVFDLPRFPGFGCCRLI